MYGTDARGRRYLDLIGEDQAELGNVTANRYLSWASTAPPSLVSDQKRSALRVPRIDEDREVPGASAAIST